MKPVPYVSQVGNTPRNDCGPACALMLLRWIQPAATVSVADLSRAMPLPRQIDPEDDGTTSANLASLLRGVGLTPTRGASAQYPYLELVDYAKLPHKWQPAGVFLHWIVRLDDTHYHDPYWPNQGGANLLATKAQLDAAEHGAANRVGIVERPEVTVAVDEGKAREPYQRVVNVIPPSATADEATAIFRAAWLRDRQTVTGSYDDAGIGTGLQSKTAILHDIPAANQDSFRAFYRQWYPSTVVQFVSSTDPKPEPEPEPPTPPPPTPQPGAVQIGLNCLDDAQAARAAYDYGCRMFLIMNNYGVARELADKGATVLFRKYVPNWQLNGDQIAALIIESAGGVLHPAIIHTLFNEWDSWPGGTAKQLRDRGLIEKRATEILLGRGTRVALGSFSVGTPDITNPEICAALREVWAPIYNGSDRVYLDQHTYSGKLTGDMSIWYELRWQKYLTDCGFDPNARRIISGETGVDEGGIGGFPAHNATPAQLVDWCRRYKAAQAQAVTVNGKQYASPFIGGTIFQCGGNQGWQGYNVAGYLPAMKEAGVWG